jgi:hypothetical protein
VAIPLTAIGDAAQCAVEERIMTPTRPERFGADRISPEVSGPEKFAPVRPAEKLSDIDQAASAFEGEIREFVRRDVSAPRRPRGDDEPDPVTENLNNLIKRVSGASTEEIDRVLLQLQGVRDMLRVEGERVTREIADSLAQWKNAPGRSSQPTIGAPK